MAQAEDAKGGEDPSETIASDEEELRARAPRLLPTTQAPRPAPQRKIARPL